MAVSTTPMPPVAVGSQICPPLLVLLLLHTLMAQLDGVLGAEPPPAIRVTTVSNCSYSVFIGDDATAWLVGGLGRVHMSRTWHSEADGSLQLVGRTEQNGSDAIGRFSATVCDYLVGGGRRTRVRLQTSVRLYSDWNAVAGASAVVFQQSFPDGARDTNTSVPRPWSTQYTPSSNGVVPFAEFPAFDVSAGRAGGTGAQGLGYLTWRNELQFHDTYAGTFHGGKGVHNNLTGLSHGPTVLFEEVVGGVFPTAVVSPLNNFRVAAQQLLGPGCSYDDGGKGACQWLHGPSGELTSVPAGYTHRTIISVGSGIRGAMNGWGATLLQAHNTTRMYDPSLHYLGVFTDNGAFYDAEYWPTGHQAGRPTDASSVLAALAASYSAQAIPVHYIQLDDWWYVMPEQGQLDIVACTISFQPRNITVGNDSSTASLFPKGLGPVSQQYGGLMLYMVNFCPVNDYLEPRQAAESFRDPSGRYFLSPLPNASEDAYGRLMDDGVRQGMTLFEIDFLGDNFDRVPYYRTTAGAAEGWLKGMSRAAEIRSLPVQLCSAEASGALASAQLPAVTQMRASQDYACSCNGEPWTGNWDIGGQSLLLSSLGLGPSKDTFFTQGSQPGINHGESGKCAVDNHHAELDLVVATLSRGPVGPGDGLGNTNRTLLMRCCAADGRILSPSASATPIDAMWAQNRTPPAISEVTKSNIWTANSIVPGGLCWHYILAIDVPAAFLVAAADLWPSLSPQQQVLSRPWHSAGCMDGAVAATCGVYRGLPDAMTGLPPNGSPVGTHFWKLVTVSPVTSRGVALLGELEKVVAVSPARFSSVSVTADGGLSAEVMGAPNEQLLVTFVVGAVDAATGSIRIVSVSLSTTGSATVMMHPEA